MAAKYLGYVGVGENSNPFENEVGVDINQKGVDAVVAEIEELDESYIKKSKLKESFNSKKLMEEIEAVIKKYIR